MRPHGFVVCVRKGIWSGKPLARLIVKTAEAKGFDFKILHNVLHLVASCRFQSKKNKAFIAVI